MMDSSSAGVPQKGKSLVSLSEKDIEGASLAGRHPTKLTIQELQFWLSCRAVRHTKLKTKAELVARVLEVAGTDAGVVDPTPDKLYTKRKFASLDQSGSTSGGDTSPSPIITPPTTGWQRIIPPNITFNDVNISEYALNSGKRAMKTNVDQPRKKTCIRPETKGYRFFTEKFLHDIWCVSGEHIFFKASCFPSQRKNDEAHKIWCAIEKKPNYDVKFGQCTCVAGKSGYCNHLMALLYQISHFAKSGTTVIPDDISKTSMPMTWQKPRIEGIVAEPIMQVAVGRNSQNRDFPSTLYEARSQGVLHTDPALLQSVQQSLAAENPRYGICMAKPHIGDGAIVQTQLGTWVPLGSPLSYQLALTEGDYHVECHALSLDSFKCRDSCVVRDMALYPQMPLCPTKPPQIDDLPQKAKDILKMLDVDSAKSHEIEMETREQTGTERWWVERKLRLTASKFGEVVRRKKANCKLFVERLQKRQDVDVKKRRKMPMALKHGRDYERIGIRKYHRYMSNIGHTIEIRPCGLVVREDFPYIGATPDGKVLDPVAHPHFGILEVKCPYKYRGVKPREAATIDSEFCLDVSKQGRLHLRKNHAYYNQVQGQMLITGAKWCDFIVYTHKGLHIERIGFDETFCDDMLQKLKTFYFSNYVKYASV